MLVRMLVWGILNISTTGITVVRLVSPLFSELFQRISSFLHGMHRSDEQKHRQQTSIYTFLVNKKAFKTIMKH